MPTMPHVLVLQHSNLASADLSALQLSGLSLPAPAINQPLRIAVNADFILNTEAVDSLNQQQIDHAILPDVAFNNVGLIVSDMDSTLITIECIDEIAAGVGLKDEVAAITELSMCGELDFEQSLRQRVALLKGLPEKVLQDVYDNVLQLSPGAEYLLAECKKHNVKFMLVSGGFTFFTERLQQQLDLDYAFANVLEAKNGVLTGGLLGNIVDAQTKADLLVQHRQNLNLKSQQVLAMGDGANDIPMILEAGFGVAYRAKPKTQAHADVCINHGGLEAVRGWFR